MQVLKRSSKKFGFSNNSLNSYIICRFQSDSKLIPSLEERKSLFLMKIKPITTKDLNKIKLKECRSEMNSKMKELDKDWNEEEIEKVKF